MARVKVNGRMIEVSLPANASQEQIVKAAEAEYDRKNREEEQASIMTDTPGYAPPGASFEKLPGVLAPFQYPEGDTTPGLRKAIGYGIDSLNMATLPFLPGALRAAPAATLGLMGLGAGTTAAANMAGVDPEYSALIGGGVAGAVGASPKISGAITGGVSNMWNAARQHPWMVSGRGGIGALAHYMGAPPWLSGSMGAAIALGPEAVEGARMGAAGKPWVNPEITRALGIDTVHDAEFVPPVPRQSGRGLLSDRVTGVPPGEYVGYQQPSGPVPRLTSPVIDIGPTVEATRSKTPPINRTVSTEVEKTPSARKAEETVVQAPKTNPKSTPGHNRGQVNNPPAVPDAPMKVESKSVHPEHNPTINELPAKSAETAGDVIKRYISGLTKEPKTVTLGWDGGYSPGVEIEIPTKGLQSSEPTRAFTDTKQDLSRTLDTPVEVLYDLTTGKTHLMDGHHRVAQAQANNIPIVKAKISFGRTDAEGELSNVHPRELVQLPKPDAASAYTDSPEHVPYAQAVQIADQLGVPATHIMRWLESNGYPVEQPKLSKTWQKVPGKKETNEVLDLLTPEQIKKLFGL